MMGGASVLSWSVKEDITPERDAISSLKLANAAVVAIRDTLGGGVGLGVTVGVGGTSTSSAGLLELLT